MPIIGLIAKAIGRIVRVLIIKKNKQLMKTRIILLSFLLLLCAGHKGYAQKVSVSTDIVDWAYLWTVNGEVNVSVDQHFTVLAGGKINPWKFDKKSGEEFYDYQMTAYAGARYWPWHVFAGWWIGAKAQYSSFERTGIINQTLKTGKSVGAGLSAGYTFMLNERLTLEVGAGFWGGSRLKYAEYDSPATMNPLETKRKGFIAADELTVALMYIF